MNFSIEATKHWLRQMFVDHANKSQALARTAFAKQHGIDMSPYSQPFPGSTTINMKSDTQSQPAPPPPPQPAAATMSPIAAVATFAATLLAGGLAGRFLTPPPPATSPTPTITAPPLDLELRWELVNGEWKTKAKELPRGN